jgi:hypothetical protein
VGGEAVDTDIEEAGDNHAEQAEENDNSGFHYPLFCLLKAIKSIRLAVL